MPSPNGRRSQIAVDLSELQDDADIASLLAESAANVAGAEATIAVQQADNAVLTVELQDAPHTKDWFGPSKLTTRILSSPLGVPYESITPFTCATWAQRFVMVCWGASTHIFRIFPAHPRLYFCADKPKAGKTVNMQLAISFAMNSYEVGYSSQASIYQFLEAHPDSTFGLDEMDKAFGDDGRKTSRAILAAVINSGYAINGKVLVVRGGKGVFMPCYAPIAMAGIGTLPADTLTRCISLKMEPGIPEDVYVPPLYEDALKSIGEDLGDWLMLKESQVFLRERASVLPNLPYDARDRLIMSPLYAVAELAGLGDVFRMAMKEIKTGITEHPPAPKSALLLRDLRQTWEMGVRVMTASECIANLKRHPSGLWLSLADNRVGHVRLASMMRANGIETKVLNRTRGYTYKDVFSGVKLNGR